MKWVYRILFIAFIIVSIIAVIVVREIQNTLYSLNDDEIKLIEHINKEISNHSHLEKFDIPIKNLLDKEWEELCIGLEVIEMDEVRSSKAVTVEYSWSLGIKKLNGEIEYFIMPNNRVPNLHESQFKQTCFTTKNVYLEYNKYSNSITFHGE